MGTPQAQPDRPAGPRAFLAPFALLTTHAGAPVDVVRDDRRADLEAVVGEVAAVAAAA